MSETIIERDQLAADDAAIECAAIALCWSGRPVLTAGLAVAAAEGSAATFWRRQSELNRRIYLHQARVVVSAWCEFWETHDITHAYPGRLINVI